MTEATSDNSHTRNIDRTSWRLYCIMASPFILLRAIAITSFTERGDSSDGSILLRPPQCGEGTPPSRGQQQHHLTEATTTWGLPEGGLFFALMWCIQFLPSSWNFPDKTAWACRTNTVPSGVTYCMLLLATCYRIYYHLHPFHFMLFKF